MSTLPNALVIGAAKAGTTSLCDDLARHSDVYFYHSKETHFFSFNYDKGLPWYKSLFSPADEKIIIEGSPEYASIGQSEEIAQRIHAVIPDARLLYMVRNPLQRIASMYVQKVADERSDMSFHDALRRWPLIDGSLYEKNYRAFADVFGEDQIHVIFLHEYTSSKQAVLEEVTAFLGISRAQQLWETRAPKNTRDDKYFDASFVRKLRKFPGFYRFKGLVSQDMRTKFRQMTGTKVKIDATWSASDRAFVLQQIAPDAKAFLARFGRDPSCWDLT
ncbi:sulfotransferase family protein [Roseobacter litoralis]|uniref:sulfotransferase family protein n=1 Tax=Roseobacter litoralis TaxID=42443 RepID=UPI00248FE994|nr:sulfotransferase [Roseobacter litoralis]